MQWKLSWSHKKLSASSLQWVNEKRAYSSSRRYKYINFLQIRKSRHFSPTLVGFFVALFFIANIISISKIDQTLAKNACGSAYRHAYHAYNNSLGHWDSIFGSSFSLAYRQLPKLKKELMRVLNESVNLDFQLDKACMVVRNHSLAILNTA
jgi:hypothetical protein